MKLRELDNLTEEEQEKYVKPLLTPEFLEKLEICIAVCGWSVDMVETESFLNWCKEMANT